MQEKITVWYPTVATKCLRITGLWPTKITKLKVTVGDN